MASLKPSIIKHLDGEQNITLDEYLRTFPITMPLVNHVEFGDGDLMTELVINEPNGKVMMEYLGNISIDTKYLWQGAAMMCKIPFSRLSEIGYIDTKRLLKIMAPLLA